MATTPTDLNPTGVETFDLSDIARSPAYQALAAAMDQMTKATGSTPISQTDWLKAVADVAAAMPYADGCPGCHEAIYPASIKVDDSTPSEAPWLDVGYWCPSCLKSWSTGYAADIVGWI